MSLSSLFRFPQLASRRSAWHGCDIHRTQRRGRMRLSVEQLENRVVPSLTAGTAVPGQLLIGFRPGLTQAAIAGFYADHGLSELQNLDIGPDRGLRLVATPTALARALIPD